MQILNGSLERQLGDKGDKVRRDKQEKMGGVGAKENTAAKLLSDSTAWT